jgi:hypothetical protein
MENRIMQNHLELIENAVQITTGAARNKDKITLSTAVINAAKYQFKQINQAMIYPSEKAVSGILKQHGWEEEKIKIILKQIEKHLS